MTGEHRFADFLATSSGWAVLAFAGLVPAGAALASPVAGALLAALVLTVLAGVWLRCR